jgi:thioredoxin 2
MENEVKFIVCPNCLAKNRISENKLTDKPKCGKCKNYLFVGKPVELTDQTFMKFVRNTSIPVVVDFWAEWCGPCKMMAPAFEQLAGIMEPKIRVAKLNVDNAPQVSSQFRIRSIPTIAILSEGKLTAQRAGAMGQQELTNWIQESV